MTVPLVLSASSVTTFLRCGRQWYYAYVAEIKSAPTVRQVLGIAVHAAIETNMFQKLQSHLDLPVDQVLDSFSDAFEHDATDIETFDEPRDKAKDSGVALLRKHHFEVAPRIQPIWVEEPVQFAINGVPYSGMIDLVDDRQRVRDWKTTAKKPQANQYLLNMVGYALAYRQRTGETESDVVLDYLVRTKTPQYIPISSGGPIDQKAIVNFAGVVTDVADAIQRGDFVPNGLVNGACSWCGYKNICPAYQMSRTDVVEYEANP